MWKFHSAILLFFVATYTAATECPNKKTNLKLFCYYSQFVDNATTGKEICKCSHIVLPEKSDGELIGKFREIAKGTKILVTVTELNQDVVDLLKNNKVDGIDLNLKKLESKDDVNDFISTIRTKFGTDLYIVLSVPPKAEILAKYYDFKALSKSTDLFILETAFLGASTNVTFHPSRLSGLWDMQNTDSIVDLVSGLGAALAKLVITAPVQGFKFHLQSDQHTAPGSPATQIQSITRTELCTLMKNGDEWMLERDQDQAGPYIFSKDQWIAFEDNISVDVKAKYSRVRGLAGLALKDLSQDDGIQCESTVLNAAYQGLSKQSRAPRGAVLHSLEREIRETTGRPLDTVQVSPYRITRVIDVEGNIHSIRQDTRTEFACSRQGYFVHPRSCNRFYRCVKFDQLTDEFNVFEFDCPAGLVFDEKVEVCVWPGNLPNSSPCSGSSEIAPVPKERFICPGDAGYYADPENCRWFFACLDHGKSPLSAYEFRCPYGLVFDESRLLCEWPWLVPRCGSGYAGGTAVVYGNSGSVVLDQYNGLGVLGSTKLGGLQGPLPRPVTQIYTNVGSTGLDLNSNHQIINSGVGGLSHNVVQSLESAGLLKSTVATGGTAHLVTDTGAYQHNQNLAYNSEAAVTSGGQQNVNLNSISLGHVANSDSTLGERRQYHDAHLINGLAYNANINNIGARAQSHQSLTQYHNQGLNNAELSTGIAGNINIIKGGYSAVGVADSSVEISNNGAGSSTFSQVTPSPISVTTISSIPSVPAVTSVPLPSLSTVSSFQSFKGGVVANVPELQYRVEKPPVGYHSNIGGSLNLVNISSVVSSTPLPAVTGYNYPRPSVAFVEEAAKNTAYQGVAVVSSTPSSIFYQQNGGYVYNKPSIAFEETPVKAAISTYSYTGSTAKPLQSIVQVQPTIQPEISISTYQPVTVQPVIQKQVSVAQPVSSYNYVKPAVQTIVQPSSPVIHQPALSISTVRKQVNTQDYQYQKPSVVFEEKPAAIQPTITTVVQPAISLTSEQKQEGYVYQKPAVVFEETPVVKVQPTVQVQTVQPAISVSTFQKHENVGSFHYEKPHVTFVEQPTAHNIVQPVVQQPLSFSSVNIAQNQGYTYPKPSIAFEEKPGVQTVVQPTVQTIVQPTVAVSTYQNYQTAQGYSYPKPAVIFEERPTVQPSLPKAISLSTVHRQEQVQGYTYQKPTVTFEEKPVVNVAVQTVTQPSVSAFQGYQYPKPFIRFEEKPAISISTIHKQENLQGYAYQTPSIVQTYSQPAVAKQPALSISTSYKQENVQGYSYPKPTIAFEEKPVQPVVPLQPVVPVQSTVQTYIQPAVVQQPAISISTVHKQENVQGYSYQKPSIIFEEKPKIQTYVQPTIQTTAIEQPAVSVSNVQKQANLQGYSYTRPSIAFEERPIQQVVSVQPTIQTYVQPTVAKQPAVSISTVHKQENTQGYIYQKPSITFEERPVQPIVSVQPKVHTYVQPTIVKQPAVSISTIHRQENTQGYIYQKPSVSFEERPVQPVVSIQPTAHTYAQPTVVNQPAISISTVHKQENTQDYVYQKPSIIYEQRPVQPVISVQPTVHTYVQPAVVKQPSVEISSVHKQENTQGYIYERPSIAFEEKPVQPVVPLQPTIQTYVQPTVVSKPAISFTTVHKHENVQGYNYPKPTIVFEEKPVQHVQLQPTVQAAGKPSAVSVSAVRKQTQGYSYTKPTVIFEEKPAVPVVQTYVRPTVIPTIIKTPAITAQTVRKQEDIQGYNYPKPTVIFEEKPAVRVQPALSVTSFHRQDTIQTPRPVEIEPYNQIFYSTPATPLVKQQININNKVQPYGGSYYYERKPAVSTYNYKNVVQESVGYSYPKPSVTFEEIPKTPAVISSYSYRAPSTVKSVINQQTYVVPEVKHKSQVRIEQPEIQEVPFVKKTAYVTGTKSGGYVYPKPQIRFEEVPEVQEVPFVKKTAYITGNTDGYVYEKPKIQFEERPLIIENYQAPVLPSTTPKYKAVYKETINYSTPKAIVDYSYVQTSPRPTLISTIESIGKVPVVPKQDFYYYDSRLSSKSRTITPEILIEPTREYLPSTTQIPTPTREYLPSRSRVKTTTETTVLEYLPTKTRVKVTTVPSRDYLPAKATTPRVPTRKYLPAEEEVVISTRRPAKVVKIVRPKTIVKQNDFNPLLTAKLGAQCTCTPSARLRKKKPLRIIVEDEDDDDDDDGYEVEPNQDDIIVENYQYEPQKVSDITAAPVVVSRTSPKVIVESSTVPIVVTRKRVRVRPSSRPVDVFLQESETTDAPSDREIAKAVRTGLKLVKQAAKEGATEALNSRTFDRYGPGGVRSRNERLQGTIDCQRAGLFRHPTQCNKFYACRWDCTKNRYTLHVFNCPVHLTFDNSLGACNWPSQGPACAENTLLPSD